MTNAGWYPDPAGQPNTYRFWNGQFWSEETTVNPASPAPGTPPGYAPYGQPTAAAPVPPPAPQQYGAITPPPPGAQGYGAYQQPGYGAGPAGYGAYGAHSATGGSGGSGKTIAFVLLAVVLILALGVGAFFVVRSLGDDDATAAEDSSESADPSESGATDGTDETDEPTDEGTSASPTATQCNGGQPDPGRLPKTSTTLTGGGLTIPSLVEDGYKPEAGISYAFTWADEYQASYKEVPEAGNWISNYGVGGLNRANGFDSTQQAAEVVLGCMTASDMYAGFADTTDLEVGPVTVDGHDAYSIVTEIRVDDPDVQAEGDVTQIVVVDTGDPDSYGLYISAVTIGDEASIDQQAEVFDQIQVD